jgi:Xaa-Pro aminopeptidase
MYYDLTEAERIELEETLGQGICPPIPESVWTDRITRCRQLMSQRGIDALLVYSGGQVLTGRDWARYFANYKEPLWNAESFIFIPLEGDLCFIVNYPHMVPLIRRSSPIRDVRAYAHLGSFNRYAELVPIIRDVVQEREVAEGNIGICRHGMQGDFLPSLLDESLREALAGATLGDASTLLWELTAVKTEYDVEMIRRSNAVLCDGVEAIYDALGEGRKEHEYYAAFWEAVCDRGAEVDEMAACHVDSQSAPGSEIPNKPFSVTLRRLKKGDVLMIDPGVTYRGYVSDIARTAVIGKPSAQVVKMFDATMAGHRAMVEVLKPGATVSQLSETYFQTIEKHGFKREHSHLLQGHGIGFMKNEPPLISLWAPNLVVRKGMTISIETALMQPGLTRARVEDTYLVTDGAAEKLTPGPQDLYVA